MFPQETHSRPQQREIWEALSSENPPPNDIIQPEFTAGGAAAPDSSREDPPGQTPLPAAGENAVSMDASVHLSVSHLTEAGKQIPTGENLLAVTCPKPRGYLQYLTTTFQRCFPGAVISVGDRETLLSCGARRKNMVSLGETKFLHCLELRTTDLGYQPNFFIRTLFRGTSIAWGINHFWQLHSSAPQFSVNLAFPSGLQLMLLPDKAANWQLRSILIFYFVVKALCRKLM